MYRKLRRPQCLRLTSTTRLSPDTAFPILWLQQLGQLHVGNHPPSLVGEQIRLKRLIVPAAGNAKTSICLNRTLTTTRLVSRLLNKLTTVKYPRRPRRRGFFILCLCLNLPLVAHRPSCCRQGCAGGATLLFPCALMLRRRKPTIEPCHSSSGK